MPRFFFDFRDGARQTYDREGLDLASAERAKREAMIAVTQVLQLEVSEDDQRIVECRVRNDWGAAIYSVSLGYNGSWSQGEDRPTRLLSSSRFSLVSRIRP